jgi:hypothetical protein
MAHIVIYDKQASGNPIVSIQPAGSQGASVSLADVYPSADPRRYGLVVVPGEVIDRMTLVKAKVDRKGKVVMQPVMQEKTKALLSASDSALGQNILLFGEPYDEIRGATDAEDHAVPATAVDPKKGLVGVGKRSGYFSLTCAVATGAEAPETASQEKNWEWVRDATGAISGMRTLK